jgi:hypothetical protein
MIFVSDAIRSLRPGAEYVMYGDDVENIIWHTEGVQPLTKAQVDTELARLEQETADKQAAKAAALASAKAKLSALGLDIDEVNAVIGSAL